MEIPDRHQPTPNRHLRIILWILLFFAAAEFVLRGPVRFLGWPAEWNDLSQNYTASKLWLKGQNPSDPRNFVALWKQEVGSRLDPSDLRTHSAPPPGTLVILAPIAAFPWPVAKIVWVGVLLISFVMTVWTILLAGGFRDDPLRTLAFITGCLALAPFHTGIASGNESILVIAVCAMAIWAASSRRDVKAGLLFGLACSLKPHLGSFLVLYYLLHRRWRLFVTALAFTAALVLVAIFWMHILGVSWAQDYFHNVKVLATENKIDDFTSANPARFLLINLQVPLYSFTGSSKSANIMAWSCGTLLVGLWIYLTKRGRECGSEILALGTIAVIGLMPVYHRLYDASFLALPLCWCVSRPAPFKKTHLIAMLLIAPFFVPGTAFLQQLAGQGRVPVAWTNSWWWDRFAMPHETWALLLLCLVLLYEIKLDVSTPRLRN
jgi:Glycosyltransferase family 87